MCPLYWTKPVRRVFFENKDAFELLVFGSYGKNTVIF